MRVGPPHRVLERVPPSKLHPCFLEPAVIRFRAFPAILIPLLLLSSGARTLSAQATTSLNGRVTDSSGAAIPAANVTLKSAASGASREIVTDSTGQYQFSQLAPGRYTLTVSANGFATR